MDIDEIAIFERIATALEVIAGDITAQREIATLRTNKLLAEYQRLRDRLRDAMQPYDCSDAELMAKSDRYWQGVDQRADAAGQAVTVFEREHPEIVALWEAQPPSSTAALDTAAG
jgi:hypothetical protein